MSIGGGFSFKISNVLLIGCSTFAGVCADHMAKSLGPDRHIARH